MPVTKSSQPAINVFITGESLKIIAPAITIKLIPTAKQYSPNNLNAVFIFLFIIFNIKSPRPESNRGSSGFCRKQYQNINGRLITFHSYPVGMSTLEFYSQTL